MSLPEIRRGQRNWTPGTHELPPENSTSQIPSSGLTVAHELPVVSLSVAARSLAHPMLVNKVKLFVKCSMICAVVFGGSS